MLKQHYEKCCSGIAGQTVNLPVKDGVENILKFKNFNNQYKAPFIIIADFESITCKINNVNKEANYKYQRQIASGYCIVVLNCITQTHETYLSRGETCMKEFCTTLNKIQNKVMNYLKNNNNMIMTDEDKKDFENAKECHICKKQFTKDDVKVRDHCHYSGRYRGCAHKTCNLKLNYQKYKIPVFFHN